MKIYKRFCALLLGLLAAALLLPVGASAAGSIDLGHTQSLTITAVYADMPISGLRFDPAYLHQNLLSRWFDQRLFYCRASIF